VGKKSAKPAVDRDMMRMARSPVVSVKSQQASSLALLAQTATQTSLSFHGIAISMLIQSARRNLWIMSAGMSVTTVATRNTRWQFLQSKVEKTVASRDTARDQENGRV
jgi:hypothetical protein